MYSVAVVLVGVWFGVVVKVEIVARGVAQLLEVEIVALSVCVHVSVFVFVFVSVYVTVSVIVGFFSWWGRRRGCSFRHRQASSVGLVVFSSMRGGIWWLPVY